MDFGGLEMGVGMELRKWWIGGLDDGFGEFWQVLVLVSWGCFCELNIFFINSVF
jgi:hypothetical protein